MSQFPSYGPPAAEAPRGASVPSGAPGGSESTALRVGAIAASVGIALAGLWLLTQCLAPSVVTTFGYEPPPSTMNAAGNMVSWLLLAVSVILMLGACAAAVLVAVRSGRLSLAWQVLAAAVVAALGLGVCIVGVNADRSEMAQRMGVDADAMGGISLPLFVAVVVAAGAGVIVIWLYDRHLKRALGSRARAMNGSAPLR